VPLSIPGSGTALMTPAARLLARGREHRALVKFAKISIGIFVILCCGVITGATHGFDRAMEVQLYLTHPWTDHFLLAVESPGQRRFVYPLAIVGSGILSYRRKDLLPVLTAMSALVFTNAITGVFKLIFARGYPRTAGPNAFNFDLAASQHGHIAGVTQYFWTLGAFPSGHASNVAAASTLLIFAAHTAQSKYRKYSKKIIVATVVVSTITLMCSWLRNTHWIMDLLAGVALGVAATSLTAISTLSLPEQWRSTEVAGKFRIGLIAVVAGTLTVIFAFASSSILSHSSVSVVLVIGVVIALAIHSRVTYVQSNKHGSAPDRNDINA